MGKQKVKSYLMLIGISAVLVLLGDRLVLKKIPDGNPLSPELTPDAAAYVQMITGDLSRVVTPFRYRILAPLLARELPFPPLTSLLLITYLSLFFCYLAAQRTCARLGLSPSASLVALFLVYSSQHHLYFYFYPYLVDGFGLLALSLMLMFLVDNSFGLFLFTAGWGMLVRENTIFLVPVWLATRQWGKTILVIASALALYIIVRKLLAASDATYAGYIRSTFRNRLQDPMDFFTTIFLSWRALWLLALLGLALLPREGFLKLLLAFVLILLGGLLSCFFAADIFRIFQPLFPVMVVLVAQVYASLRDRSKSLAALLILLFAPNVLAGYPTLLLPQQSWMFSTYYPRLALLAVNLLFAVFLVLVLREQWTVSGRENLRILRSVLRLDFWRPPRGPA